MGDAMTTEARCQSFDSATPLTELVDWMIELRASLSDAQRVVATVEVHDIPGGGWMIGAKFPYEQKEK
jgi:hypothetical protein